MPINSPSPLCPMTVSFEVWRFKTPADEKNAAIYSFEQVKFIENEIVSLMNQKVSTSPQGTDTVGYLMVQEYLRGQIEILQWLLTCSRDFYSQREAALREVATRQ